LLYEKEIKEVIHKTCLPNYDVFDEYRYFEPAYDWKVVPFKGKKIALTICEDIWSLGDNPLYRICPMDKLMKHKPDLMINISASPFDYDHDVERRDVVRTNVLKYKLPMFYCNTVGSQTEIVFDGGSVVYDAKGNLIKQLKLFEEDFAVIELTDDSSQLTGLTATVNRQLSAVNFDKEMRVSRIDDPDKIIDYLVAEKNICEIHDALILGIRDYFFKMGFSKAILGSSGGIDSAVTLALACKALGKENVRAVLMPSQYSTSHSVSDAEQLSKNIGNPYDIVPIKGVYQSFIDSLHPIFGDLPFSIAEENIQSRTRGNLLMAIANKFSYILLNTSNKSELATGYGTLYGDMAGGLSVLGDVYKMQVYGLAKRINADREIIPRNIFAAGDVVGQRMVVHHAHIEAGIAGENAVKEGNRKWARRSNVQVVFSDPEFAFAGQSPETAEKAGHKIVTATAESRDIGKLHLAGDDFGFGEFVADANNGRLLGAGLLCDDAANLIHLPAYAIDHQHTTHTLIDGEYYHPTKIEIVSEIGDALCRTLGGAPFFRATE
jgi:NAD+ synthetase